MTLSKASASLHHSSSVPDLPSLRLHPQLSEEQLPLPQDVPTVIPELSRSLHAVVPQLGCGRC